MVVSFWKPWFCDLVNIDSWSRQNYHKGRHKPGYQKALINIMVVFIRMPRSRYSRCLVYLLSVTWCRRRFYVLAPGYCIGDKTMNCSFALIMTSTTLDRRQVSFFKFAVWPNRESNPNDQIWWRVLNPLHHFAFGVYDIKTDQSNFL